MACRYTYQGKTYEAHEFDDVLRAMSPSVAAKYMPGITSVPDAPMIADTKAWVALGMKKAIVYAIQNGMTRVAWANGEQNAGHYDLSKTIGRITYEGSFLRAFDHGHKEVIAKTVEESELADTIGKDAADKLMSQEGKKLPGGPYVRRELSGLDLKVGGEGMKAFYDQIVPQVANEVLKKLGGGKVETVSIPKDFGGINPKTGKPRGANFSDENRLMQQSGFTITPAMRAKVSAGLPLFSRQSGIGSPSHRAAVEYAAKPLLEGLANTPGLVVVQHSNELPFSAPRDVQGVFWRGNIYLVADNITSSDDTRDVVAHELVGHFGLRGFFGNRLASVLNDIHANNPRVQALAKEWSDKNQDHITDLQEKYGLSDADIKALSIEEALSGMAGRGEKLSGWKRLAAAIQSLLRAIGLHEWANSLEAKTDAEALLALKKAELFSKRGFTQATKIPDAAYPLFMTAYHGSPHDHDKFDMSKVGTGEGGQAYGYGLYFSSLKAVGAEYRKRLSQRHKTQEDVFLKGEKLEDQDGPLAQAIRVIKSVDTKGRKEYYQDITSAKKALLLSPTTGLSPKALEEMASTVSILEKHKLSDFTTKQGRLYKVDIAPTQDELLDWNKPLSEQSEFIQNILEDIGSAEDYRLRGETLTGERVVRDLYDDYEDKKAVSDYLYSCGIRGITYIGDRNITNGEGARNYVIFNDADVTITAKFSRPRNGKFEKTGFRAEIDAHPSPEVVRDVEFLRERLEATGRSSGIPTGAATITPAKVPDAARGMVSVVKRIFNVDVRFVRTKGLDPRLDFNGIYVGRNVLYVDGSSTDPFSQVIGHEFLHYLKNAAPALYQQFVDAIPRLVHIGKMKEAATTEADRYTDTVKDSTDRRELGYEEVRADFFGDAWSDPKFWEALAAANPSVAQKALNALRQFINRIKAMLMGEKSTPLRESLYRDFDAVRDLVLETSQKFAEGGYAPYMGLATTRFMTAYHGSPHDHDKFDMSKVGTGEGNQSYGHGLYFASVRELAEHYRDILSGPKNRILDRDIKKAMIFDDPLGDGSVWQLGQATGSTAIGQTGFSSESYKTVDDMSLEDAYKEARKAGFLSDVKTPGFAEVRPEGIVEISDISKFKPNGNQVIAYEKGKLYQVELAPSENEYLDWDKPLSEQSELVQSAIAKIPDGDSSWKHATGNTIYKELSWELTPNLRSNEKAQAKAASEYLHSLGIRGIRYLDGSSRSAGEGGSNYVIFNDADVTITAKFNKANSGRITPADKAVYGMVNEGKSATDILKFIAASSRNPFYRQVAKLLLKTGVNPTIIAGTQSGWKMNAGDGKYAAAYNPKTDTVALFRPASSERNAIHELIHAASIQALGKPGIASGQMKALFDHVTKTGKLKGMYGMTDIDEFMAEVFSNPKFQQALKKVNAPAGSNVKTAWDWFIRTVRGILGLQPGSHDALSRALDLGVQVMRENMAEQTSNEGIKFSNGLSNKSPVSRTLDGAELTALRRAAAGIERTEKGVFLRVEADGRAIATGPKGTRIPETFRRFAHDNSLAFYAERRVPRAPDASKGENFSVANTPGNITSKSAPMPIAYREGGARYFGEDKGTALDRTDRTRFNTGGKKQGSVLLAPNGKPSKLNARQHAEVRTKEFKAWFGDWEAAIELQIPANGIDKEDADVALSAINGKDLINIETGIVAKVSSKQAAKLVSNAAVNKSINNGFSRQQHYAVASKIEQLWRHALMVDARGDKDGDANIASIKRFAVPVVVDGKTNFATILAKESVEHGHRVYTVEMYEIKTLRGMLDALASDENTSVERTPTRSVDLILDQLQEMVNPSTVSKAVDENGEPMVVYHGTRGDYSQFDPYKVGDNFPVQSAGFYFSSRTNTASIYADSIANAAEKFNPLSRFSQPAAEGGNVMPVYVALKNPMLLTTKEFSGEAVLDADGGKVVRDAKAAGHDGVIVRRDVGDEYDGTTVVAFIAENIKSSIGNNGQFDGTDPDIRHNIASDWYDDKAPTSIKSFVTNAFTSSESTSWVSVFNTQYHKAEKWADEGKPIKKPAIISRSVKPVTGYVLSSATMHPLPSTNR